MAKKPLTDEQRAKARERARVQNAKPETKARKAQHQNKPENLAKRAAYYQRPEVKAKYLARSASDEQREYMKQWRASERGKRVLKNAGLRQRGFTLELWETLIELQGGACAICRRPFPAEYREIHADHCHDEMRPRGLLCQPCNLAEGQIKKTGLSPSEYARRLEGYLASPPVETLKTERAMPEERN